MAAGQRSSKRQKIERRLFFLFTAPWILGFLIFTLGPLAASVYISFTDWNMLTKPNFIGLENYIYLFSEDKLFWKVLYNTFYYVFIMVPLTTVVSLLVAYLLNKPVRGIRWFRTIFYLQSVVPVVASSLIFLWILAPKGIINQALAFLGLKGPAWLLDERYVKMSFVMLALWAVGGSMILLLSGMQSISKELYESAALDGASRWRQFCSITIPMLSPITFFNLIMGIIGGLQTFSQVYILTKGGPNNASKMIVPYLYDNAFKYYRMGYASALSWVLFVIILAFTLAVLKSSSLWVFYEGEVRK